MVNDTQSSLKNMRANEELPTTPYELMKFLKESDINFTFHEHEPVFTVEESHKIDASISGTHTRNLFLKDKKDRMFLITLRHDTALDLKKLEPIIGASRLSFGSQDRLWTYLGVRAGSVTPFAIINDTENQVQPIWEKGMMEQSLINFHPLLNSMTIGVTPSGLKQFARLLNKTPLILDLDGARPI